ncbi:MarR family winged helix-turn-helix transcriptional regulator [Nocardia asteroides]|uniref:MarR family winged helix-turn-helix transcriptional regulator n=1 Tax=Nocardia asteroides TaxID=1824 RepID=UPI001E4D7282|nr:MarR family winged helix-turn-helix transcriptional regulator [Nocardia asteroides]UGT55726.1 MarR family winged helix-turn-helix transcriptional regulator [Nocardia asteroides]
MNAPGPGQSLFAFVRHWSRRSPAGDDELAERGRSVLVTEAVHALTHRGDQATVNAITREIGIDQSGASRLIKSATQAGYLAMRPGATDGRVRHATLTSAGHTLLDQAHAWQEEAFDQLTAGWTERRRSEFHRAMTDLMSRSHTLDH